MRYFEMISGLKVNFLRIQKKRGGLGIKDINSFNRAFLAKWRWCLFHNPESLWIKLLCSKYGRFSKFMCIEFVTK
uniref:Uncharacterized protein n=1 Tax=Cajanus cajan TaxID=3821 RepID=A0A151REY4_CAJCA|nr:hypothetical protein KK1_037481 [Cajanus cajan]